MSRFPNVLAAVELRAKHQGQIEGSDLWAIGDALKKDIELQADNNSPKFGGWGSGFYTKTEVAKLEACSKELAAKDYPEYSPQRLAVLRNVARIFPRDRRHFELSFSVHDEADNPDFLDWCVKAAKKRGNKKLSVPEIRAMRARWREMEDEKWARVLEDERRNAKTDEERQKVQRKIDDNLGPPDGDFTPPDDDEGNQLILVAEIMRVDLAAKQLTSALRDHQQKLRRMEDDLTEDLTESLIEKYESVVQVAQQLVDFLKTSKRNRFKVIKGGKHAS